MPQFQTPSPPQIDQVLKETDGPRMGLGDSGGKLDIRQHAIDRLSKGFLLLSDAPNEGRGMALSRSESFFCESADSSVRIVCSALPKRLKVRQPLAEIVDHLVRLRSGGSPSARPAGAFHSI